MKAMPGWWPNFRAVREALDRLVVVRLCVWGIALLYGWMIYLIYRDHIAPWWDYMGYAFIAPSHGPLYITLVLGSIPSLLLPLRAERPSGVVVWLLYLMAYVPSMLIPLLSLGRPYGEILPLHLSLLAGMSIVAVASRLPLVRFQGPRLSRGGFTIILLAGAALMYVALVLNMGFRLIPPAWDEITDVRMDQRVAAASAGIAAYTVSWLAMVVNPVLVVLGIQQRRRWLLYLGLLGQFFMFAQGGQKSMLLVLPLIWGVDMVIRHTGKGFGIAVTGAMCVLLVACLGIDLLIGNVYVTSLLVRRAVITPGLLTGFYFDFYSTHSLIL